MIQEFQHLGFTHVGLENDILRVVFLPEIGGKMTRLENKVTGTQFLLEPQNDGGEYLSAGYGADFEQFDTSGFDECFPTIEESEYPKLEKPNEMNDIILPDHGELWSRPWDYQIADESLVLSIAGVKFDYRFTKRIALRKNRVILHYALKNNSDTDFSYLWSAHPLLKVNPGTEMLFLDDIDQVFVNWASEPSIGKFGDHLRWPNGETVDYSVVQERKLAQAMKLFTHRLRDGLAGVYHPDKDESLFFHFDTKKTPYLGLWLCYGGWPESAERKHLTVGLEPTNGRPDSLKEAVKREECAEVASGETHSWSLQLSAWQGKPNLNTIRNFDYTI